MVLNAIGAPAPQRADNPVARLLPIATTLFATVISIQPAHIPGYAALTPAFTLMAVYHWTIYRPDLLPSSALFLVGITQDLLAGVPPGVTAFVLLVARAAVLPSPASLCQPAVSIRVDRLHDVDLRRDAISVDLALLARRGPGRFPWYHLSRRADHLDVPDSQLSAGPSPADINGRGLIRLRRTAQPSQRDRRCSVKCYDTSS